MGKFLSNLALARKVRLYIAIGGFHSSVRPFVRLSFSTLYYVELDFCTSIRAKIKS